MSTEGAGGANQSFVVSASGHGKIIPCSRRGDIEQSKVELSEGARDAEYERNTETRSQWTILSLSEVRVSRVDGETGP